ncbi:MAG: methyltransferase domain-containing protein [Anaerolineae bacterium]|nr:methyltransferase domain-containing protein [Anaerolineae bacterium]
MSDDRAAAPLQHYDRSYFSRWNYADRGLGRFSMYWFARRYYAALVRRFAPAGQGNLLELGCGLGHLLGLLQEDFRCTGIDLIDYAVEQTRKNAQKACAIQGDAASTDRFADEAFDAVVGLHLIEHLPGASHFATWRPLALRHAPSGVRPASLQGPDDRRRRQGPDAHQRASTSCLARLV